MSRTSSGQRGDDRDSVTNRGTGAGQDAPSNPARQEDEPMQAAYLGSATGQRPVSALGWGIALGGGALIWAMLALAYVRL